MARNTDDDFDIETEDDYPHGLRRASEQQEKDSLSELSSKESKDSLGGVPEGEDVAYDALAPKEKKNGKKTAAIIIGVIVAVLVLGGLGFLFWWQNSHNSVKTGNRTAVSSNTSDTSDKKSGSQASAYLQDLTRLGKASYYQRPSTMMSNDDRAKADSAASDAAPSNSYSALASSRSNKNLTDDQSKAHNADGSLNENYSYLTAENVSAQVRDDVERLTNPIYGGWSALQNKQRYDVYGEDASSTPFASLADMFVSDKRSALMSASEADGKAIVPLFADWNKDDFGGKFANRVSPTVAGIISGQVCSYNIQGYDGDTITCKTEITYDAQIVGSDSNADKTITRVLTINYVVNYNDTGDSSRRILIDSVQQ